MTKKEGRLNKPKAMTKAELEQALIDNFVNLQKVLTNLAIKFDDLSSNISKMMQLFEISAKSFAEKYSGEIPVGMIDVDKEFLKKLDSLLDQNKVISKGIMLMEERIKERAGPSQPMQQSPQMDNPNIGPSMRRPLPRY